MARTGKIARLPWEIRRELNQRLHNGEAARPVLAWLNGLEETREAIKCHFNGEAVTEQNLSDWRLGGHQEWLRHEEACDYLRELDEDAHALFQSSDEQSVSTLLTQKVAVELALVSEALLAEATDPKERWRILKELLPHLAHFRRADHREMRLEMQKVVLDREQGDWEMERDGRERQRQKELEALQRQQAAGTPGDQPPPPNKGKSCQIVPNQGKKII